MELFLNLKIMFLSVAMILCSSGSVPIPWQILQYYSGATTICDLFKEALSPDIQPEDSNVGL